MGAGFDRPRGRVRRGEQCALEPDRLGRPDRADRQVVDPRPGHRPVLGGRGNQGGPVTELPSLSPLEQRLADPGPLIHPPRPRSGHHPLAVRVRRVRPPALRVPRHPQVIEVLPPRRRRRVERPPRRGVLPHDQHMHVHRLHRPVLDRQPGHPRDRVGQLRPRQRHEILEHPLHLILSRLVLGMPGDHRRAVPPGPLDRVPMQHHQPRITTQDAHPWADLTLVVPSPQHVVHRLGHPPLAMPQELQVHQPLTAPPRPSTAARNPANSARNPATSTALA